jgi:hypothetical protein
MKGREEEGKGGEGKGREGPEGHQRKHPHFATAGAAPGRVSVGIFCSRKTVNIR